MFLLIVCILDIKGRSRYHRGSKEAVQMMLAWPGSPCNIPEKEGQTPLWHALDSAGKNYNVYFFSGPGFPGNDHFDGFVKSGMDALVRITVWTRCSLLHSPGHHSDLVAGLAWTRNRGKTQGSGANSGEDTDSSSLGDSSDKAKLGAFIKRT